MIRKGGEQYAPRYVAFNVATGVLWVIGCEYSLHPMIHNAIVTTLNDA